MKRFAAVILLLTALSCSEAVSQDLIRNPILPGFNPDPCITRAGEDYYIVTSTFEWFPGLPVYHSKDLANWRQVGHVLTRRSQLDLTGITDANGVYAPSITYADGKFYVVYTVVQEGVKWSMNGYPNYIVTAEDPAGPWSEPVLVNSLGFDPSLFIDEDGRGYMLVRIFDHRPGRSSSPGIGMHEIDMETLRPVGEPLFIYSGWARSSAEGPHLLKKDGYYYLFTAEGGTGYGHYEAVARSRNIWGPYERAPSIFYTSRDDSTSVIQKAGHGMLVETPSGEWYTTHLGSRPYTTRGACCLGRETFIQPVRWTEEGWPELDTPDGKPRMTVSAPALNPHPFDEPSLARDEFDSGSIDVKYQFLREPYDDGWLRTDRRTGFLSLRGRRPLGTLYSQSMIAQRITSFRQTIETCVEFEPTSFKYAAGLVCYYNSRNFYFLNFSHDEELGRIVQVCGSDRKDGYRELSDNIAVGDIDRIYLRMEIDGYDLRCYLSPDGKDWFAVGGVLDFGVISDDYAYGYTGAMAGLFVQDLMYENKWADFDYFELK